MRSKPLRLDVHLKNCNFLSHEPGMERSYKGVGEGGQGGHVPPHFQKWGGTSGFVPPTFGQIKCSNCTICSYFVVTNTIFSKFSWLASLANFSKSIFSKFC